MVLNKAWSNILDTHFTTWGRKEILPLTFFKNRAYQGIWLWLAPSWLVSS